MKTILCYGDSNTFGFNPSDGSRYDEKTRWTGVLRLNSGEEYNVIEAGANNRTGFVQNPDGDFYSAQQHLPNFLSKTGNIDIIVLALGTNDLQFQYDLDFDTAKKGLEHLIRLAKTKTDDIILIPPVVLNTDILHGYFKVQFDKTSINKSADIVDIYKKAAVINNCRIFDINEFVKPSETDGLHYSAKSHKIIADKLSELIKKSVI